VRGLRQTTVFSAIGGLLSLGVGGLMLFAGTAVAVPFLVLGIVLFSFAPYRLLGFKFGIPGVSVETKLAEVLEAAARAPSSALEAVLPMLRGNVASDVVTLPPAYDGQQLKSDALAWIRQKHDVSAFAVKRPDENEWIGGGRISELALPEGTELALVGDRADLGLVRDRLQDGYGAGG
jgi:hypothetical protein